MMSIFSKHLSEYGTLLLMFGYVFFVLTCLYWFLNPAIKSTINSTKHVPGVLQKAIGTFLRELFDNSRDGGYGLQRLKSEQYQLFLIGFFLIPVVTIVGLSLNEAYGTLVWLPMAAYAMAHRQVLVPIVLVVFVQIFVTIEPGAQWWVWLPAGIAGPAFFHLASKPHESIAYTSAKLGATIALTAGLGVWMIYAFPSLIPTSFMTVAPKDLLIDWIVADVLGVFCAYLPLRLVIGCIEQRIDRHALPA